MRDRRFAPVRGPVAPYVAGFWEELERLGHTATSAGHRMSQFRQVSQWLEEQRLSPSEFDDEQAGRFLTARRSAGRVSRVSPGSLAVPLVYLRAAGVIPPQLEPRAGDSVEDVLAGYRGYLEAERGLVATTVATYVRIARSFLAALSPRPAGLAGIVAADVSGFLVAMSGEASAQALSMAVTAMASLLQYLHVAGVTAVPLARTLPGVARRRAFPPVPVPGALEVSVIHAACHHPRPQAESAHPKRPVAGPPGFPPEPGRSRALPRQVQFDPASAPGNNDAVLPRTQAEF